MMTEERCEYYHEIHACISCLGFLEDGEYKKEPDVEDSIKDLLRYLRKERSDSCAVRREIGRAKIVVSDLIPLLKTYPKMVSLFEVVIRLLMNLTQPAIICFRNEVPTEKLRLGYYLELEAILRDYKLAFADADLMRVLSTKVSTLLERDWADRSDDDRLLIERVLIVVRNILHISQDANNEKLLDAEVSLHDQVLWAMKLANWDTLLLFLSNSDIEQSAFAFHTLEIMSLLFREQDPAILAKAGTAEETRKDDPEKINLQRGLLREAEQRRQRVLQVSYRHNRFGGCYELRGVTALGDTRNVLYHHNPAEPDRSFDRDKPLSRVPRNRAPRREREFTRRSSLSVRLFLRQLGGRFLAHCYNPLMRTAMAVLQREAAQENDETYYMWAMRFFMALCRHSRPTGINLVSETLNVATFHWLFNQMTGYLDHLRTDRKKGVQWSRRLHLAVSAYREMLECLASIDKIDDVELRRSAHILKSNVFYMQEYREIFPHLLKNFDQRFQNRSYLCDLVQGAHLLVKLLGQHQSQAGGALVVKRKARGRRKPRPSAPRPPPAEWTSQRLEAVWSAQADAVAACVRGETIPPPPGDLPQLFDAAALPDGEGEEGRRAAVRRALAVIQDELRAERPQHAVALLRLARELWPEEEALSIDDELLALRDIHMTPIEREAAPDEPPAPEAEQEQEQEEEEEEVVAIPAAAQEAKFDLDAYLHQFAHPNVVEAYALLLAEYERNSDAVNGSILRMFHRLAVRLNAPALLFQLRIFRVFQHFLVEDPLARTEHYREMHRFAIYILRKFFDTLQRNDKLAIDVLFWKSLRESKQIMAGDYLMEEKKSHLTPWTEELDAELRQLFEELRDQEPEEFGTDTGDLILSRFSDPTKTRRQIVGRLVTLRLISSVKELKKRPKPESRRSRDQAPKVWTEEEFEELKEKVAQIEPGQPKPLHMLRAMLSFPISNRDLKSQLLLTGLAPPSWRLRPLRQKSTKRTPWSDDEVDERLLRDTSSSSSSDDEVGGSHGADLKSVIGELMSTDQSFLKWLHEELTQMEVPTDGVPDEGMVLVPIEVEHAEAVDSEPVKRILRALGLVAPDASSRYWRVGRPLLVPGVTRERYLARLEWLQRAAEGGDLTEESALNVSRRSKRSARSPDSSDLSSLDESFWESLRGRRRSRQESDDSEDEDDEEKKGKKKEKKDKAKKEKEEPKAKETRRRKKKIHISEINFSSEDEDGEANQDSPSSPPALRKTRGRRISGSSADQASDASTDAGEETAAKPQPGPERDEEAEEEDKTPRRTRSRGRRRLAVDSEDEEKESDADVSLRKETPAASEPGGTQDVEKTHGEDADDEDDEDGGSRVPTPGRRRRRLAIDSDEEEEAEGDEDKREGEEDPAQTRLSTSRRLLSDSEDEDRDLVPQPKKRRVIMSDDSDSE